MSVFFSQRSNTSIENRAKDKKIFLGYIYSSQVASTSMSFWPVKSNAKAFSLIFQKGRMKYSGRSTALHEHQYPCHVFTYIHTYILKNTPFFPNFEFWNFHALPKKIGQNYQSLQKGGTLTNWVGRLFLNNLSLHIRWVCICPPLTQSRILVNQDCCHSGQNGRFVRKIFCQVPP